MIKINLLGEDTVIDQSGKLILLGYASSLVLTLVVFVLLQSSIASRSSETQQAIDDLNGRLASLKKVTDEVRQLEKKKDELDLVTATIAKLKLSQGGPVHVLDDLNMSIPAKAWLTNVDEKNGIMNITGIAISDPEIVTLMKNLETSDYFETIDLNESVTISLIKVTSLNQFANKYTRYIVRAEDKQVALRLIQDEARRLGLKYENTEGPPPPNNGGGSVSIMSTGSLDAGVKQSSLKSGVFKAGSGRIEKMVAWSTTQPVQAKQFRIKAKILYAGKLKKLLEKQAKADEANKAVVQEKAKTL